MMVGWVKRLNGTKRLASHRRQLQTVGLNHVAWTLEGTLGLIPRCLPYLTFLYHHQLLTCWIKDPNQVRHERLLSTTFLLDILSRLEPGILSS